jgi:hypothetical protein
MEPTDNCETATFQGGDEQMRASNLLSVFLMLFMAAGIAGAQDVLINEVDADQTGTDASEFIELYGTPGFALDGMVIVLINGSDNLSYNDAIDLDGFALNGDGFFVIGSDTMVPAPDLVVFTTNGIQNGADAVALFYGDAVDYPNDTDWTVDNLIDAVVYDTNDSDDLELAILILAGDQVNEGAVDSALHSIQRCPDGAGGARVTTEYVTAVPTPGASNDAACAEPIRACCDIAGGCTMTLEVDCWDTWYADEEACDPNPCPIGTPTEMALCDAVALDADGVAINEGEWVHITSSLIVLADYGTYASGRIDQPATDGTCCVYLFDFNLDEMYYEGDELDVIGVIETYNGKVEITDLQVTLLSSSNPLPEPEVIDAAELQINGNDYESCLVRVNDLTIASGDWPAEGSSASLDVTDGVGTFILRIDSDTDIDGSPEPAAPFAVIGIVGQYDYDAPYHEFFQLLPRYIEDIIPYVAPVAVCCVGEECTIVTAADCEAVSGMWHEEWDTCDPNPCYVSPTNDASWGSIKNSFK